MVQSQFGQKYLKDPIWEKKLGMVVQAYNHNYTRGRGGGLQSDASPGSKAWDATWKTN
jgi:hypothetical protein